MDPLPSVVVGAGACLLPPIGAKVFGSRSHFPVQLQSAVVCRSTGRCGAIRARILGYWRSCGGDIAFPSVGPHLIRGTHSLPLVQPHVHPGQSLGGGSSLVVGERSNRAGSSSFSGLLQPAVYGDEGLRVVEAGHRPLVTESEGLEDYF